MTTACKYRLSPCSRGEDEGEGFERTCVGATLTLTLSLRKGEVIRYTLGHSQVPAQT